MANYPKTVSTRTRAWWWWELFPKWMLGSRVLMWLLIRSWFAVKGKKTSRWRRMRRMRKTILRLWRKRRGWIILKMMSIRGWDKAEKIYDTTFLSLSDLPCRSRIGNLSICQLDVDDNQDKNQQFLILDKEELFPSSRKIYWEALFLQQNPILLKSFFTGFFHVLLQLVLFYFC